MQELLRMHLGEEPPALESVRKGLPAHVSQAIQRAMAKDPADRYPSAMAFVDALAGDAAVGTVRSAHRASPQRERAQQWLGNALALVLVVTASIVGWTAWRKSRDVPAPAPVVAAAPTTDTLAARLARELEETRKIALDAQRRAERAEAQQKENAVASRPAAPAPVPVQTGHVGVMVRGGAPKLIIDDKEVAATTPAFINVPVGRHVVRVEQTGKQFLPGQYVIDVAPGDTSRLQFSDPKVATRELQQMQRRFGSGRGDTVYFPRGASSARSVPGATFTAPTGPEGSIVVAPPAAPAPSPIFGGKSANPYGVPDRIWREMSQPEQIKLQVQWDRLTTEQKSRVMRDIRVRFDSARAANQKPD
jgi:hypothetical protein